MINVTISPVVTVNNKKTIYESSPLLVIVIKGMHKEGELSIWGVMGICVQIYVVFE